MKPQIKSMKKDGELITPLLHLVDNPTGQGGGLTLSSALALGRIYHPICRGEFVEKVLYGSHPHEQWIEWQTDALAAAYAGIFGPAAVERSDFCYTQCCWHLTQVLGYDPAKLIVEGPTGRRLPVADEMVKLVDIDLWSRRAVAAWLRSKGL